MVGICYNDDVRPFVRNTGELRWDAWTDRLHLWHALDNSNRHPWGGTYRSSMSSGGAKVNLDRGQPSQTGVAGKNATLNFAV